MPHTQLFMPPATHASVVAVCRRIPPLWDLPNFVAVNPFLGFAGQPFVEAAHTIADGLDARVLPTLDFYRARWQSGAFGQAALVQAATRHGQDAAYLHMLLEGNAAMTQRPASIVYTFAEQHDQRFGTSWHTTVTRTVALWCAALVPEHGTVLRSAAGETLFASWRATALLDRSLAFEGLRGWREWLAQLPLERDAVIATLLDRLGVEAELREAYLYRLLGGVYGWASLVRRATWQDTNGDPGALADLLAIRLCTDAAVAELVSAGQQHLQATIRYSDDEAVLLALQDALEDGYATRLLGSFAPPVPASAVRPSVQAIFCIDVRSEVLRRHLEAQSSSIETRGFAGFFGVSLDWQTDSGGSARCPVLLAPGVGIRSLAPPASRTLNDTLRHMQSAPAASFSFVEVAGLAYGASLAADALTRRSAQFSDEGSAPFSLELGAAGTGMPIGDRIELASGMLKNMGLRDTFARLVLLAGHQSQSENNPHAAGLECGACGGHSGAINARVAGAILNDSAVREGLLVRGWNLPADTWFVPAVHDTAIDSVTLLDTAHVPPSHSADLSQLTNWLAQAGAGVRAERAPTLGMQSTARNLFGRLRQRGRDWSEVRPEWALARNAAFIAARRVRTRGVDLAGRAFLHEYDWTIDDDNSILSLILAAPMVVASWINLQYFGSTVDNQMFGSGTKTLHNRVGSLGVVLGNGGDLRGGLALQSVQAADGTWYHEPLRLQVIVEAPHAKIESVLAAHPGVAELVDNGWVRLFALDPASNEWARRAQGGAWEVSRVQGSGSRFQEPDRIPIR